MGIAREIGEHGLGAGERRLGIDHEPLLPDCGEATQEQAAVGETCLGAEEGKSPGLIEFDQLGEEQAAEERAQHPALARGRPDAKISSAARRARMPPPRTIMWMCGW